MYSSSPLIQVMIHAARSAGRLLTRDFSEIEKMRIAPVKLKQFVKAAELRSEKMILEELLKTYPTYGVLAEESGISVGEDANYTWVIDPLDGSTNFLRGIPSFAISVALRKKNEIKAGVIYDPIHDDIFFAEHGKGAFLNQTRLRIKPLSQLSQGIIGTSYKTDYFHEMCDHFGHVRIISTVALSLAYLAAGRLDAYLASHLKVWDLAAGVVLIKEAGGMIDDLYKKESVLESCSVLAASPPVFEKMRFILSK